jgi:hypothetical protein
MGGGEREREREKERERERGPWSSSSKVSESTPLKTDPFKELNPSAEV